MGIQDLYKIIPKNQLVIYRLTEFEGMKCAIDISIFLYKTIRSCGPDGWINYFILFLCNLKKSGLRAVCVFDGPNPPPEKAREQKRRRDQNGKALDRLKQATVLRDLLIESYLRTEDPLPDGVVKQCKDVINPKKKADFTIYSNTSDVIESLKGVVKKLTNQTIPITDDYKIKAKEITKLMGLKVIQADGEAEGVCAALVLEGYVDMVLTEDTDVLAYGTEDENGNVCPLLFVAFKDYKITENIVIGIDYESMIGELGMTASEFQDLCILLSCDYNDRVKGYPPDGKNRKKPISIGAKYAMEMIESYRTLENIEPHLEDAGPLIYERCRELFTPPYVDPREMKPCYLEPDYEALENFIRNNRVTVTVDYIKKCYKKEMVICEDSSKSSNEEPGLSSEEI